MEPSATTDRAHLADVLLAAGPDAPTLDEGWAVRDLAAHLVLREGRPAAAASVVLGSRLPALAARTAAVQAELAARPFEEVVERFRSGPPRWSPFSLPGAEAANAVEFYVHAQDVVRAAPGARPGPLRAGQGEALWRSLRRQARLLYRRSPVGVVLVVPSGPRALVRRAPAGAGSVVVTGRPEELLLHAFGRTGAAQVEVTGSPAARAAFASTPLGV